MIRTPLTTVAPGADPAFADWTDVDIELAVRARWNEDTDAFRALHAEQRRRDAVHDRRALSQIAMP